MTELPQPAASTVNTGPLRLTVFGANGGSGAALVTQALDAGHYVTAVTRHPEQIAIRHDRLTVLKGDATNPADVVSAIDGADAVLSALGVPYSRQPISLYSTSARHIVEAMNTAGINRLVVVTSSAVDPEGHPDDGSLIGRLLGTVVIGPVVERLGKTMYEDMRAMEAIVTKSGLDWTIVRPPALFDKESAGPMDVSTDPIAGRFAARQDLAALMLQEATGAGHTRGIVYIGSLEGRPSILATVWRDGILKALAASSSGKQTLTLVNRIRALRGSADEPHHATTQQPAGSSTWLRTLALTIASVFVAGLLVARRRRSRPTAATHGR